MQAAGMAVILVGFVRRFPEVMSYRLFVLGVGLFTAGWLLGRSFLKK